MKYDGMITIATGNSRRSTNWKNKEMLWSEFVDKLGRVTRTQETQAEYARMPKDERDSAKDVGGFVGGTLKGGRRKIGAVTQRRLITLDMDSIAAGEDPWPTVTLILGCAAVLYSTHSHTPKAPRLRLVIPLSRPVSPEEYEAIARRIAGDIGIDMCDDTTYEPHRLMYWASASADAEFRYEVQDGPWLDADEQLKRYADWQDPTQWPVSSRKTGTMRRLAEKQGDPTAKDGIVGAFCRIYSIEDAIDTFYLIHIKRVMAAVTLIRAALLPADLLSMTTVSLRIATTAQTLFAANCVMLLTLYAYTFLARTTRTSRQILRQQICLHIKICVSGLKQIVLRL